MADGFGFRLSVVRNKSIIQSLTLGTERQKKPDIRATTEGLYYGKCCFVLVRRSVGRSVGPMQSQFGYDCCSSFSPQTTFSIELPFKSKLTDRKNAGAFVFRSPPYFSVKIGF